MSLESLCIHRVTIQKETITQGAGMGKVRSWANARSNFPCRVNPLSSDAASKLMKDGLAATHEVWSYQNFQADEEHRLIWVDPSGVTRYLYVRGDRNAHGLNRVFKLLCEELRVVHDPEVDE